MKRLAVIALIALSAVACGGSSHAGLYTKEASRACLTGKKLTVGPVSTATDFIASTATGGSFSVGLPPNRVVVSFGATVDDANNIDQAYRGAAAKNVGINDVLRQQGNAVMLWHLHPSDADIATITGCLKG